MTERDVKSAVREHYAGLARTGAGCCGSASSSGGCCGTTSTPVGLSREIGYSERELGEAPEGSNLGLGCGNPLAHAALGEGDVVVDLGSGAGFDCFLAANRVGPEGRVIGIDMTPEMLERARANAVAGGYTNVEFRLGEIENLPVADGSADMVISNCVINLAADKGRVFREALRVLKPGGRLMVSDLVLRRPLPESVRRSVEAYVGCIAGAMLEDDYLAAIRRSGFTEVELLAEATYPIGTSNPDETEVALLNDPALSREDVRSATDAVVSVKVAARKP
ncbi:MAG TPA: arsenite methyltransferase [Thermoanaerobaculaceae bacterium]|nr:MAG: arsenite S-adenosylmethyltransferase [Acidobacteria bacterium 37-71-11]HQT93109.1 arsenite methyltransferase [Thermoanaerobaculaceae bacterium]HQU32866.1 arsenite methyltransferase [Thermoanaerobaculaceae bacterium]